MNGVNRLHILQLTHVWPGLILVAPFAPLMARSRWWVIPVAMGFGRLFVWGLEDAAVHRDDAGGGGAAGAGRGTEGTDLLDSPR